METIEGQAQARERGHDIKIGKFPMVASGKALALGETEGMVKLVVDAEIGEVLGAFLAQFYENKPVPKTILVSHRLNEEDLLAEALLPDP